MCNRYKNKISYDRYKEMAAEQQVALTPTLDGQIPNLEPQEAIRPTDLAPILRMRPNGDLVLSEARFGLIPYFHKGAVKDWKMITTNARSETVDTMPTYKTAFQKRRCLVPFTSYVEWTGDKGHKTEWDIKPLQSDFLCFAGIWDQAHTSDGIVTSFSILTQNSNDYVAKYHDRQPLILTADQYRSWLTGPVLLNDFIDTSHDIQLQVTAVEK